MKTIWKFRIPRTWPFSFDLSEDFEFLSIQMQDDEPTFWVMLDESKPHVKFDFDVAVTGGEVPETAKYLGTYQSGWFVGHLFLTGKTP